MPFPSPIKKLTVALFILEPHYLTTFSSIVVVQSLIHIQLFVTPYTATCQASLSFTISQSLLKLVSFKSVDSCYPTVLSMEIIYDSIVI